MSYEGPSTRLEQGADFYVVLPEDGRYQDTVYSGSGYMTAQAISQALAPYSNRAFQASAVEPLEEALAKARQGNFRYLFNTKILHWEDRATEWSGIPDKITLQMEVYDATTGEKLASETSKASSKWATFGGDHPQDLLPIPAESFVKQLF
ncbi:DUF4823 domain-containing protein [Parvibaculum indicum]|uniref:DUF4823 domain-containing protein n=1 Tax=Parvibaculum indicum TaxID=562969 RepID=UPI0031B649E9